MQRRALVVKHAKRMWLDADGKTVHVGDPSENVSSVRLYCGIDPDRSIVFRHESQDLVLELLRGWLDDHNGDGEDKVSDADGLTIYRMAKGKLPYCPHRHKNMHIVDEERPMVVLLWDATYEHWTIENDIHRLFPNPIIRTYERWEDARDRFILYVENHAEWFHR